MNLGISMFKPEHAPLARRLGCTWAHWCVDLTDSVPDERDQHECAAAAGLQVVADCRTSLGALRRVATTEEGVRQYAERILQYLEISPWLRDIEVWGNAEVAYIKGTMGPAMDYARILNMVAPIVREARPDVTIWTGGFGIDFDPMFADACLGKRVDAANYDVVNWHPCVSLSPPEVAAYRQTGAIRLDKARRATGGKPFAASLFGVPTVPMDGPPPPAYGDYWRVAGARALCERGAVDWYVAMLDFMREEGFETVCLKAQDHLRPGDTAVRMWPQVCGLLRFDGTEKAFVQPLIERLS